MLISWNRTISLTLIRSLNPIPSAVPMSTKTPSVEQAALISGSTTEANHHTCGTSGLAQSCRVIDSDLWSLSTAIKLDPREWSFFNTETPHVIYSFLSSITTKNEQMWFGKYNRVTVSSTWSRSNNWNNHPLSLVLTVSHIKQI